MQDLGHGVLLPELRDEAETRERASEAVAAMSLHPTKDYAHLPLQGLINSLIQFN